MCKISLTKQMTADEKYSKCDSLSQHQVAPKIFAVHWTDWFTICRCVISPLLYLRYLGALFWSPIKLAKPHYRMLRQLSRKVVSPKSTIRHLEYCNSLKYKSKCCMQVLNIHYGFRGRKYIKGICLCTRWCLIILNVLYYQLEPEEKSDRPL